MQAEAPVQTQVRAKMVLQVGEGRETVLSIDKGGDFESPTRALHYRRTVCTELHAGTIEVSMDGVRAIFPLEKGVDYKGEFRKGHLV